MPTAHVGDDGLVEDTRSPGDDAGLCEPADQRSGPLARRLRGRHQTAVCSGTCRVQVKLERPVSGHGMRVDPFDRRPEVEVVGNEYCEARAECVERGYERVGDLDCDLSLFEALTARSRTRNVARCDVVLHACLLW